MTHRTPADAPPVRTGNQCTTLCCLIAGLTLLLLQGCGDNSFWDASCDSEMKEVRAKQGEPEEVKNYQSGNYSSVSWWYWKKGISYTFTYYKQCDVSTYTFSPIR